MNAWTESSVRPNEIMDPLMNNAVCSNGFRSLMSPSEHTSVLIRLCVHSFMNEWMHERLNALPKRTNELPISFILSYVNGWTHERIRVKLIRSIIRSESNERDLFICSWTGLYPLTDALIRCNGWTKTFIEIHSFVRERKNEWTDVRSFVHERMNDPFTLNAFVNEFVRAVVHRFRAGGGGRATI